MSDNPFSEPDDGERTIIRPVPGGRQPKVPVPPEPAAAAVPSPTAAAAPAADGVEGVAMGLGPLVAAAAPLLQLLARLRNTVNQPDPGDLRERAVRAMRDFEQRARDAGVPLELLRPAHYALCASLDDVVLNTPWGSHRDLGRALAGFDLSSGSARRRAVFRPARADAPEPGQVPAGRRADVPLHVARLPGALPAVVARSGRARPVARGNLCADRPAAPDGRARPVAALAGRCRTLSRPAADGAGLGRRERGTCRARRALRLVLRRPQRALRRSLRAPVAGAARPYAGDRSRRPGRTAAAAGLAGRRPAVHLASARGRPGSCHRALHAADAGRPHQERGHVRFRQRRPCPPLRSGPGAHRRGAERRGGTGAGRSATPTTSRSIRCRSRPTFSSRRRGRRRRRRSSRPRSATPRAFPPKDAARPIR